MWRNYEEFLAVLISRFPHEAKGIRWGPDYFDLYLLLAVIIVV